MSEEFQTEEKVKIIEEDLKKKYRIYAVNGEQIKLHLSDSFTRIREVQTKVEADMELFKSIGKLMTAEDIEIYQEVSSNFPLQEAKLQRILQLARDRHDLLERQRKEMQYIRKDAFRKEHKIHLGTKDDIESALLANDMLYEQAVVQFNIQTNYVLYLEGVIPQYTFIDKRLDSKLRASKFMREVLYD
jgi:hypothetical protein